MKAVAKIGHPGMLLEIAGGHLPPLKLLRTGRPQLQHAGVNAAKTTLDHAASPRFHPNRVERLTHGRAQKQRDPPQLVFRACFLVLFSFVVLA